MDLDQSKHQQVLLATEDVPEDTQAGSRRRTMTPTHPQDLEVPLGQL